jgi:hypothetical protein
MAFVLAVAGLEPDLAGWPQSLVRSIDRPPTIFIKQIDSEADTGGVIAEAKTTGTRARGAFINSARDETTSLIQSPIP